MAEPRWKTESTPVEEPRWKTGSTPVEQPAGGNLAAIKSGAAQGAGNWAETLLRLSPSMKYAPDQVVQQAGQRTNDSLAKLAGLAQQGVNAINLAPSHPRGDVSQAFSGAKEAAEYQPQGKGEEYLQHISKNVTENLPLGLAGSARGLAARVGGDIAGSVVGGAAEKALSDEGHPGWGMVANILGGGATPAAMSGLLVGVRKLSNKYPAIKELQALIDPTVSREAAKEALYKWSEDNPGDYARIEKYASDVESGKLRPGTVSSAVASRNPELIGWEKALAGKFGKEAAVFNQTAEGLRHETLKSIAPWMSESDVNRAVGVSLLRNQDALNTTIRELVEIPNASARLDPKTMSNLRVRIQTYLNDWDKIGPFSKHRGSGVQPEKALESMVVSSIAQKGGFSTENILGIRRALLPLEDLLPNLVNRTLPDMLDPNSAVQKGARLENFLVNLDRTPKKDAVKLLAEIDQPDVVVKTLMDRVRSMPKNQQQTVRKSLASLFRDGLVEELSKAHAISSKGAADIGAGMGEFNKIWKNGALREAVKTTFTPESNRVLDAFVEALEGFNVPGAQVTLPSPPSKLATMIARFSVVDSPMARGAGPGGSLQRAQMMSSTAKEAVSTLTGGQFYSVMDEAMKNPQAFIRFAESAKNKQTLTTTSFNKMLKALGFRAARMGTAQTITDENVRERFLSPAAPHNLGNF